MAPTPDLATAYQDGRPPTPIRDGVPVPTPDDAPGLLLSPSRIFDADQFPSGGGGMVGDAAGFLRLLEAVRTGGAGVLRPETVEGMLEPRVKRPVAPGVSGAFGRGWAVITPRETTPLTPGSVQWGGVYGNAWANRPRAAGERRAAHQHLPRRHGRPVPRRGAGGGPGRLTGWLRCARG